MHSSTRKRWVWAFGLIGTFLVAAVTLTPSLLPSTLLQASGIPTIEILGLAWDFESKPTLTVNVVPNRSLLGWREDLIVDATESIARWEECIALFTAKYGFGRLSRLNFMIYVEGINASTAPTYDVSVRWTEAFTNTNIAAETLLVSESSGKLSMVTITLALKGVVKGQQRPLADAEMRAVVGEEFGHALGLGHADSQHDLMAGFGILTANDPCHSTLDIYALAIVYAYLETGPFRSPGKQRISLNGTGIPYGHLDA